MKRGMYMFSERMQGIDESMLQPYLTPGRMGSADEWLGRGTNIAAFFK